MEELGWIDTYLTFELSASEIIGRLGRSKYSIDNVIKFLKEGNNIQDYCRWYKKNKKKCGAKIEELPENQVTYESIA